jgi:hypothetical protein
LVKEKLYLVCQHFSRDKLVFSKADFKDSSGSGSLLCLAHYRVVNDVLEFLIGYRLYHTCVNCSLPVAYSEVVILISSSSLTILSSSHFKDAGVLNELSDKSISVAERVDMVIFELIEIS